jgi:hypothetical protein
VRAVKASVVRAFAALATIAFLCVLSSPAWADARTEGVAKAALKKAQADFKAMNYGTGATRLQKAVKACGQTKCTPATRAKLLATLGAMQFKKGSQDDAKKSFTDAVAASPDVALDPPFNASDVSAAFTAATAPPEKSGGGGGGGGGTQPSGDFGHTPPSEQAVNTPLPIYVDGGPDSVIRVVVKYKPESASSWKRVNLKKLDGGGWGGLIPCGDVTSGTLRYYVQGLDDSKTPIASNGDAKHPYTVQIKDSISGDAPHLPGKDAPKSCSESTDCPPDFPGCSKSGESAGENGDENGEGGGDDENASKPAGPFKRWWVGVGMELEFVSMPSANDACALDPNSALPANGSNLYCTTQSGADFPTRASQAENSQLCTAAAAAAGLCPGDAAGTSTGGFVRGDMRLMASLEYAFTKNLLAGVRLGVTLFPYPGTAAVNDGRAFGSRIYGDLRGTWVFGDGLASGGIKPIAMLGGGVGEFDGHTSNGVAYCQNPPGMGQKGCQAGPLTPTYATGTVNIWKTAGPGFLLLGGGVRWAVSDAIALTGALRLNIALGSGGVLPTLGPEIGAAYGF